MNQDEFVLGHEKLQDGAIQARLEELVRFAQVGSIVNGVTHDINNFLGAMMAYAEMISLDEGISEQSRSMLEDIIGSVRRSSQLLGQLTAIARPDLKSTAIIAPGALLQQAIELRNYSFKVEQIAVVQAVDRDLPSICGESARLQLCLDYLLSNAFEAVAGRTEQPRKIWIAAHRHENGIRIIFWNSNLPLGSEQINEKIFQPFYTTKTGPHLGLGLPFAKQIAQEHGGELEYVEDTGFILYLPQKTPFQAEVNRKHPTA